jgi:hypothetical protein
MNIEDADEHKRTDNNVMFEELKELRKTNNDQVLLNQRRMQEFERKSKQVLNIFKNLTGFSFKLYTDNRIVKLKNIYCKSDENYLIFKVIDLCLLYRTKSKRVALMLFL